MRKLPFRGCDGMWHPTNSLCIYQDAVAKDAAVRVDQRCSAFDRPHARRSPAFAFQRQHIQLHRSGRIVSAFAPCQRGHRQTSSFPAVPLRPRSIRQPANHGQADPAHTRAGGFNREGSSGGGGISTRPPATQPQKQQQQQHAPPLTSPQAAQLEGHQQAGSAARPGHRTRCARCHPGVCACVLLLLSLASLCQSQRLALLGTDHSVQSRTLPLSG